MIAAIYARKSTDQTGISDEQRSVARQVEHSRAFAVAKGWTVVDEHIYVDDGISGAEFLRRPGFLRLMNALKPRPPFGVLVMSEESRLGREAIETAYALKQLVQSEVRVFFYLEGRERTLDSPMDKVMLSLTAFADELEREKGRQRTYDAMLRKARAGHVTGGRVFGYDNVDIMSIDAHGRPQRTHVERRINDAEATVVRRIFELSAQGAGYSRIARALNAEQAPAPRAQRQRPQAWSPSSVLEVLRRPLYRGLIVWNRTRKRDTWGRHSQRPRPASEHLELAAPQLRIVDDALWTAAHTRLAAKRAKHTAATGGRVGGRRLDVDSKYLLSGFARCGTCGGGLIVRTRHHGTRRAAFYGCGSYWLRGPSVCTNRIELPMSALDEAVLTAFAEQKLTPEAIEVAIELAFAASASEEGQEARRVLARRLQATTSQLERLTSAIEAGADVSALIDRLHDREAEKQELERHLAALDARAQLPDRATLRRELRRRATLWQTRLASDVRERRTLLRETLLSPLVFTPLPRKNGCRFEGEIDLEFTISGAKSCPMVLASPSGIVNPGRRKVAGIFKLRAA